MERESPPPRTILSGLPVICLAVFLSTGGLAVLLNTRCQARFNDASVIIYPDAELVTKDMPFLGLQRASYRTEDVPSEVRAWYTRTYALTLRDSVQETGRAAEVLEIAWEVIPVDDGGSQINLSRMCP